MRLDDFFRMKKRKNGIFLESRYKRMLIRPLFPKRTIDNIVPKKRKRRGR